MEGILKKKYRIVSDLCSAYGFSLDFFDNREFTCEAKYGLHLNSRRCQSFSTAGLFKVKFWLDKMDFSIDADVLDALSVTGNYEEKERILNKYIKFSENVREKWPTSSNL